MLLILRNFILCVIIWFYLHATSNGVNRILVVERPVVEYVNSSYGRVINITSGRHGRHDPVYYVQWCLESFIPVDKSFIVHISVDEYLSYSSKRRYIDMDFTICRYLSIVVNSNIILYKKNNADEFTGLQVKSDCELPAGFYCLHNLTWRAPAVPFVVHFSEGRVNMKLYSKEKVAVVYGHIELAMRSLSSQKKKG